MPNDTNIFALHRPELKRRAETPAPKGLCSLNAGTLAPRGLGLTAQVEKVSAIGLSHARVSAALRQAQDRRGSRLCWRLVVYSD